MRRITSIDLSRAECLRRALEYDRLANYNETDVGVAFNFDQARLWRSLALVAHPEAKPEAWYSVGAIAVRQESYRLAVDAYTEAIALTPMKPDLYLRRGHAYTALGRQQIEISQGDREGKSATPPGGRPDSQSGYYAHAISDLSQAIHLDLKSAIGYSSRGVVYAAMGDQSRAVTDYTKAIDLDPSYAEAYENRSRSYYRSGDKEKGAADSAKAVSLRIARPVA